MQRDRGMHQGSKEGAASCNSILAKYETCCFLRFLLAIARHRSCCCCSCCCCTTCCGLLQQNVNWGHKLRQSGKFLLPALPFIVDIFEQLFEGERQTLISFSSPGPGNKEGNKATRQTGQIINKNSNNNNNTCSWFKWLLLAERRGERGWGSCWQFIQHFRWGIFFSSSTSCASSRGTLRLLRATPVAYFKSPVEWQSSTLTEPPSLRPAGPTATSPLPAPPSLA